MSRVASAARHLFHRMRADYLERVRRHGFLVTLGLTVYFGFLTLPPQESNYATLQITERRGIYNSAWVGCNAALLTGAFLSLAGFYLVRNAIDLDRRTRVGQILAATPLSKAGYLLGKWASNFAVLATITAVVAVSSIGMQLLRGEDRAVDLVQLLSPFLLLTLPVMSVTAGVALFVEATPVLRGGLGNVAYFFFWGPILVASRLVRGIPEGGLGDLLGLSVVVPQMQDAVAAAYPDLGEKLSSFTMGVNIRDEGAWRLERFPWHGVVWTPGAVLARVTWTLVGVGVALAASLPFDRFDAMAKVRPRRRFRGWLDRLVGPRAPSVDAGGGGTAVVSLPALPDAERRFSFLSLWWAELRLALVEMPRPWLLLALGLAVACWVAPLSMARAWFLLFAWIWPLLVWSAMGSRETRHGTGPLLYSSPRWLGRQLPAVWGAGFALAALAGSGVGVRLAAAGDAAGAASWLIGALFVPSLALAAGTWTGSGKLFEILYLALWYVGPLHRIAPLDFIGTTEASTTGGGRLTFGIATAILLGLAVAGRRYRASVSR